MLAGAFGSLDRTSADNITALHREQLANFCGSRRAEPLKFSPQETHGFHQSPSFSHGSRVGASVTVCAVFSRSSSAATSSSSSSTWRLRRATLRRMQMARTSSVPKLKPIITSIAITKPSAAADRGSVAMLSRISNAYSQSPAGHGNSFPES